MPILNDEIDDYINRFKLKLKKWIGLNKRVALTTRSIAAPDSICTILQLIH